MFPQKDDSATRRLYESWHVDDPATFEVPAKPALPSAAYIAKLDQLVVLADLGNEPGAPFGWAPMSLDRGKAAGSLAKWMALPWGGPDTVILPGFQTAADTGLKRGQSGHEIFLSICGLACWIGMSM